jgi:hypothetical protein
MGVTIWMEPAAPAIPPIVRHRLVESGQLPLWWQYTPFEIRWQSSSSATEPQQNHEVSAVLGNVVGRRTDHNDAVEAAYFQSCSVAQFLNGAQTEHNLGI